MPVIDGQRVQIIDRFAFRFCWLSFAVQVCSFTPLDAGLVAQFVQRLGECDPLDSLYELEYVAAGATCAVTSPRVGFQIQFERWCALFVEWARCFGGACV